MNLDHTPRYSTKRMLTELQRVREHAHREQSDCKQIMTAALHRAEAFITGFEGDEMQEGVDELLQTIRYAIRMGEAKPQ